MGIESQKLPTPRGSSGNNIIEDIQGRGWDIETTKGVGGWKSIVVGQIRQAWIFQKVDHVMCVEAGERSIGLVLFLLCSLHPGKIAIRV